jgi:chitinase
MGYWQDFYQDSSPLKGSILSGESAIQALTSIGFEKSQIVLGLPAYGKGFKKSGEKVLKESLKGSWDTEDMYTGIFDYSHIMQMVEDKTSGWIHEYNKSTAASIAYKDDIVISFDCIHAVQDKKAYVDTEGLAGLFMWELGGDRSNELIEAMNGAAVPSSQEPSAGTPQPSSQVPKPSGASPTTVAGGSVVSATSAATSTTEQVTEPSGAYPVASSKASTTAQPEATTVTPEIGEAGVAGSRRCQGSQLEIFNNGAWTADGIAKCSETCASTDVGSFKCNAGQVVMCSSVNTWSRSMGPCVAA